MESDDREFALTAHLVNVDSLLENHINAVIHSCRRYQERDAIVTCVFQQLGLQVKDSGYSVLKFAPLCRIEIWLEQTLQPERQIADISWRDSRYGNNKTGAGQIFRAPVISHLSPGGAEHTIVPTIRVGGVLVGIDKWAHFFTTGYHYWQQISLRDSFQRRWMVSRWLEGDHLTRDQRRVYREYVRSMKDYKVLGLVKYGVLGAWSSGVISTADMFANEFGFQFYRQLYENPHGYRFNIASIDMRKLNEGHTPSKFVKGMIVTP